MHKFVSHSSLRTHFWVNIERLRMNQVDGIDKDP